jgi:hypothetical protein
MAFDIIPVDFSSATTISNETMGSSLSSSSSSCCETKAPTSSSLENIKIRPIYHRPIIDTFYSWSDFPIVVHHEEIRDDDDNSVDINYDCYRPIPMITASSYYTEKTKDVSSVRFASSLDVRTFSVILGDHPWCEDDLPIELGWEYNMKQVEDDNQDTNSISYHNQLPTSSPSRLSYLERKNLLINVAGYTKKELELEMMMKQKKNGSDNIGRPLQKRSKSISCLSLIQKGDV